MAADTSIKTSSPGPGTVPVLQLAAVFQSPLPPIQVTVGLAERRPTERLFNGSIWFVASGRTSGAGDSDFGGAATAAFAFEDCSTSPGLGAGGESGWPMS